MDRKTFTIVLGLALVVCFFLAYWGSISGLDFFRAATGWEKYILLLIPISGLLLLFGALSGNYIGGRSLWAWLPLLVILFLLIIKPLLDGASLKGIGQGYGIGLWITIAAAVVLAFYNPRPKAA